MPAEAGERCTRLRKGSAQLISPSARLHPELMLVKRDVQGAAGTHVPVGQGWEQELTVQLTLPELRWQGVACHAVPKGKGHGETRGYLNSTCPPCLDTTIYKY